MDTCEDVLVAVCDTVEELLIVDACVGEQLCVRDPDDVVVIVLPWLGVDDAVPVALWLDVAVGVTTAAREGVWVCVRV